MHVTVSQFLATARMADLRREADEHRLAVQSRSRRRSSLVAATVAGFATAIQLLLRKVA
jgi:hypothetical protein